MTKLSLLKRLIFKLFRSSSKLFGFILLISFLLSIPSVCLSINRNEISYACYKFFLYYTIAFVFTCLTLLIPRFSKGIQIIFLILSGLHFILSSFCYIKFRSVLSFDFLEIIAGTNKKECYEFFYSYITTSDIFFVSIVVLFVILLSFAVFKYPVMCSGIIYYPFTLFLIFSLLLIRNHALVYKELISGNTWSFRFDEIVDLREHFTLPHVEATDSLHPKQIVVIIGESFARSHSSLYGYERTTNPLLEKKRKTNNLFIFEDVKTPEVHTTSAFKHILTTYNLSDRQREVRWYDKTNLIEAFSIVGYHTVWVSAQQRLGMFDNLPSGYSKICDFAYFDEREQDEKYDDYLINAFSPDTTCRQLVIYHMMGQHPNFSLRYPESYCEYGPKAYNHHTPEMVLADYDNATLFNDYVVSSIIDNYANQDAMVVYFPDHGLDLFDTDPEYFGHARGSQASIKVSKEIPFMIYLSDYCMARNPALSSKVRALQSLPFCTDNLIYLLLDLSGYHLLE